MDAKTPRPMPPSVLGSYRPKADLFRLFVGPAFDERKRIEVRRSFLIDLLEARGNTEVAVYPDGRTERIMDVASLVDSNIASFGIIGAVYDAPDYGGKEATLPFLAKAMQPGWLQWWDEFRFTDIAADIKTMTCVLGDRQLIWLAAQSARLVLEHTDALRSLAEDAIDFAEQRAIGNTAVSEETAGLLWALAENITALSARSRARKATSAARSALMASIGDASGQLSNVVGEAAGALLVPRLGRAQARSVIADLFRQIITPTLISSPM